jgi:hypothetical protein
MVALLVAGLGGCAQAPVIGPNPVQPTGRQVSAETAAQRWLVTEHIVNGAEPDAEAWLVAQNVLNGAGSEKQRRGLYTALCYNGDQSACFMASATR